MMFDLVANTDMTARALLAREERRGREETAAADVVTRFEETPFLVYRSAVPLMRRHGSITPTQAELKQQTEVGQAPNIAVVHRDAADRVYDARVSLLARKYEGVSTVEDEARLAILTTRLRKLNPRVNSADLEQLTTMVDELEKVSSNLDEIRSKFGLK
jgi:hypothetical protein